MTRQVALLYFSGTGNTQYVARELKRRLEAAKLPCRMAAADQLWAASGRAPGDPGDADRAADRIAELVRGATDLVLAFPTYASDIPRPLAELLPLFPEVDQVWLSSIATCAMAGGDCCDMPERVLRPKGYKPLIAGYVFMPNNFKLPPVNHPEIYNGEAITKFYESSAKSIDVIAEHLIAGKREIDGRQLTARLLGTSQRMLEHTVEGSIAHHLFATANCVHCELCVATCPMGNITSGQGYPEFGTNCCMCLRCYNGCPREAIQVTDKTRDTSKYPRYKGFDGWHPPRLYDLAASPASPAVEATSG